ncbi:MAG: hypothetical protein JSS49_30715 [Planctomycetes bacterium]|nr:hypothetical protein [Planctomycetota bacterium]
MTTVGKILVVLHLVLSVMFMAFAGAVFTAQKNWRNNALATAKSLATEKAALKELRDTVEAERTANTAKTAGLNDLITKLTGEKAALTAQVLTLDGDNKRLVAANDSVGDQAALSQTEAEERVLEATLQRGKNAVAFQTREELQKKLNEEADKNFGLELQIQQMVERHDKVLEDLRIMKLYNGSMGYPTDPKTMVAKTTPPPPVVGRVMDYRKEKVGKTELVEISLGSDDGLSVGHIMTVYNNKGVYLGKIRLTLVHADNAVGIVTEPAKNTTIQKGDNVTTKL